MKNARLIIILSVFVIITTIIVLCSTVFTLSTVDLAWLSTTKVLSGKTNSEIIDSGKFKTGESIFLINKEEYINNLESSNPYLRVINLEIKFPNKLKVSVAEREELYALKVVNENSASGYSYVFLDYDLKVLKITDNQVVPNQQNPAVLTLNNLNYTINDFSAGEFTNLPVANMLTSIGYMLSSAGYTNTLYKALIRTIDLKFDINTTINIQTTYGLNLKLLKAQENTAQKMLKALSVYEYYHNTHPEINSGDITVFEQNGNIVATGPNVN